MDYLLGDLDAIKSMHGKDINRLATETIGAHRTITLSCYPSFRNKELESWSSSVVRLSKDNDSGMDILSHHFMSVI